ncbi:MAG: hypothetical protein AB1757_04360 [Acidobacteriota bacterium]
MNKKNRLFRVGLSLAILFLLLLPFSYVITSAQTPASIEVAVDTAVPQDGLLTIYGGLRLGGEIGYPVGAGDINGDGRADLIMCAMYASAGAGIRLNNGLVNFYLSDGRDTGSVDLATNPANNFTLVGADTGDLLGTSVSANGDVNGDGIRDVAIGAGVDDGPGNARFNSGAVYLVYGATNFNLNADLQTPNGTPPAGIVAIYAPQSSARAGIWVDEGDVDGDGFADIIIGADQINDGGRVHLGGAYIVFGSANLPNVIDLAAPPAGVRTATILGAGTEEHWGAALQVGDINNDGIGDVIIGGSIFRDSASYVSPTEDNGHDSFGASFNGQRTRCGEIYVVYGTRNWPAMVNLQTPPATATHIIGAKGGDLLGSQVHSADLNGDGRADLICGALQAVAPDPGIGNTGAVYVIYGEPNVVGATVDLADTEASGLRVVKIYGQDAGDCAGDSVRAFDINKDSMAELFIGSPEHTFELGGVERDEAGDTKIIFGQRDFLPSEIKFYDPPDSPKLYMLAGSQNFDGGDEFSYRLWGGDVDGDGYVDYIANAMHGDGINDNVANGGQVYVFSGKKLSAKLGLLPPPVDPTPTLATSTALTLNGQVVQQANAGQSGLRVIVNGTNFTSTTQVFINGIQVVAHIPADAQLAATQRTVELDENLAIRNSAGSLLVRVKNPNSPLSNEVNAGRLIGPEITVVTLKVKGTGKTIVRITGTNFPTNAGVSITVNGQGVTINSVTVESATFISAVIKPAFAPPSGSLLKVRVTTPGGVQSNEFSVTKP